MERDNKIDILADRLAKAKQVMRKVEENQTPKNYDAPVGKQRPMQQPVQETYRYDDDQEDAGDQTPYISEEQIRNIGQSQDQENDLYSQAPIMQQQQTPKFIPFKNLNNTKMPSAIVESFLTKPMIDPTKPLGMDSLVDQVAKKINPQKQVVREQAPPRTMTKQSVAAPTNTTSGMDVQLLEFVIQKTVEATLKEISKKTNLDENIQIKIGDKTFAGKITTLKEITTKK